MSRTCANTSISSWSRGSEQPKTEPSADETAVEFAIHDTEAKVRRWEEALEKGLLLLEDCAGRIKELRHEREKPFSDEKGRITEEVSRAGKDIADTDSANGRIYPADADAAQGEKNRL